MTLDEIEDLIRRYLSTGIAVVIILVGGVTGSGTDAAGGRDPQVITVEPTPGEAADPDADPTTPPRSSEPSRSTPRTTEPTRTPGRTPTTTTPRSTTTPRTTAPADEDQGQDEEDPSARPAESDDPPDDSGDSSETDGPDEDDPGTDDRDTADRDTPDRDSPDRDTPENDTPDTDDDLDSRGPADSGETGIDAPEPTRSGPPTSREPTVVETTAGTTAAERYGWGTPNREDDFTGAGVTGWDVYTGTGYAGQGTRSADALSVENGALVITGDAQGTTGGVAWDSGQRYGRWEGRVRAAAADPSYNAVLLLWPDAEDFPEGGEIDFMEMLDPARQQTDFFLHHGADNTQVNGQVRIDGTEWHNWAVEWTPEAITAYVDGEEWFRTTDTATFPPGPMHLCIQLDWFPTDGGAATVEESRMEVDWVRQYDVDPAGLDEPSEPAAGTSPAAVETGDDDQEAFGTMVRRMFSWS